MICFHHNDRDGYFAAGVVKGFYEKYKPAELVQDDSIKIPEWYNRSKLEYICDYMDASQYIPVSYDVGINLNIISKNELVYIVDFSIPPEQMDKLLEITEHVIWIDHHKSAIERYKNYNKEIKGLRYHNDNPQFTLSGCELTWLYLFKNKNIEMPRILRYIGDYDTWRGSHIDNVLSIYYATNDFKNLNLVTAYIFEKAQNSLISKLIEEGDPIKNYVESERKKINESCSFESTFEGYSAIVCNSTERTSLLFGDKLKDYDLGIVFAYKNGQYDYSIYTLRDDLEVYKLAEKYGGGGHPKAAGFTHYRNLFEGVYNTNGK